VLCVYGKAVWTVKHSIVWNRFFVIISSQPHVSALFLFHSSGFTKNHIYIYICVLAFGTQVRGFKPGQSRRIFKGKKKILSTPSFGGEVKPSVPCRSFTACKRSLELRGSRILDEICRNNSRPRRVPPSAARSLSRRWTWRHLAEKVGTSKGGGKQCQPTPKNLSRMHCARAIPVAWLGSGSC